MVMLVRAFGWVFTPPLATIMDRAFMRPRLFPMLPRLIRSMRHITVMATATEDTPHDIMAADTIAVVTLVDIGARPV